MDSGQGLNITGTRLIEVGVIAFYYLSHCYTIFGTDYQISFFCLCVCVCVCLWARLRSHFSTDLQEIW